MTGRTEQRLALLFLIGALAINFPVLALFNRASVTVGGIPILYVYLFGVWAVGLVVAFVVARRA